MRVVGVGGALVILASLGGRAGHAEPPSGWPVLPGQTCGGYYILVDPRLYPRERLPHFALFPPVYYSFPVPRPYGYSPFAYPPGYLTPQSAPASQCPVTILNPFVPGKQPGPQEQKSSVSPANRRAEQPLRIQNPFLAGPANRSAARSTASRSNP